MLVRSVSKLPCAGAAAAARSGTRYFSNVSAPRSTSAILALRTSVARSALLQRSPVPCSAWELSAHRSFSSEGEAPAETVHKTKLERKKEKKEKEKKDASLRASPVASEAPADDLVEDDVFQNRSLDEAIGSADLPWKEIGFDFQETNGFVQYTWKDGQWDSGVWVREPYLNVHVMSSGLHYGQAVYEGCKAHHCKDGRVRLWNIGVNAMRMSAGCERMVMPLVPPKMFRRACERSVRKNKEFVPPYGSGGAMYLRPFIFGTGPQLGLQSAPKFYFCVVAVPVSSYNRAAMKSVDALVVSDSHRAAPHGVGHVKASGNYGSDIAVTLNAKAKGFSTVLYLDAAENKYVEEFSVSNLIAIDTRGGATKYVTPKSPSVLLSTTNLMLQTLAAEEFGMEVEHRPVLVDELEHFSEVAGCGTAAVMMGIKSLTVGDRQFQYQSTAKLQELFDFYRGVQVGDHEDTHNWGTVVPMIKDTK